MCVQLARQPLLHFSIFTEYSTHCRVDRLQQNGICARALQYIRAFLGGRTMTVSIRRSLSTPRNVTRDVPQGNALSPLLLHLARPSFPGSFLETGGTTVHLPLNADDIPLWYVGPTTHGCAVPTALQRGNERTVLCRYKMGLTVSPKKTASICYFPPRRLLSSQYIVFMNGQPIRRVRILT